MKKHHVKWILGGKKRKRRRESNIKIDLREIDCANKI
jgi:hypothetical protein